MNVLSLFDGMSCGQIALNRAGVKYENYYASEIDKYAINVTRKNYPNTIQLGDIRNWKDWNISKPDLIIGGSPCQNLSVAGNGSGLNGEKSSLFYIFADILDYYKPKYFLLENVRMAKKWMDIISNILNVSPIMIDSSLVSAQSRKRLYWTNITGVELPKDKGIILRDIIENGDVDRDKSFCIDANYYKGGSLKNYKEKKRRQLVGSDLNFHQSEKRLMVQVGEDDCVKGHDITKRIYSIDGVSLTLPVGNSNSCIPKVAINEIEYLYRKLTVLECEKLQTVPEGYTEYGYDDKKISNTQRYKMLGNGWTVDVIAHIFSFMNIDG